MSSGATAPGDPPGARRGQCRRRAIDPTGARPSELLTAFFASALIMLAASGIAATAYEITGDERLHWLALHLALLGGVSQLVIGAGQFFVCAFLATAPPSRKMVTIQLAVWNTGTVLVAIGVLTVVHPLVDAGAILVVAGLIAFGLSMRGMQSRSLQRARWAVRWYQGSAGCLGVGVLMGVLLVRGVAWPHGSLLGAHLALNLAGWLGTAIVGTMHTFFPSLTATRLCFPRLQGPTLILWLLGVLTLALGMAFGTDPLAILGWLALTVAASLLLVNLGASLRTRTIALSLPARLITLAQVLLPAGLVLALIATLVDGTAGPSGPGVRSVLAVLLLAGWIGLTVAGALLHLLAVLARVRHLTLAMPAPRPVRDRAVTALAALAIASWALANVSGLPLDQPALVLRTATTLVIAARAVTLAAQVARPRAARRHAG